MNPTQRAIRGSVTSLAAVATPLVAIAITVIAFTTSDLSPQTEQEYFHLAMLLLPAIAAIWPVEKRAATRILRAIATWGLWFGFYVAFVDYANHPWFAGPETNTCDGPCFGWYSFENESNFGLNAAIGCVSLAVGALLAPWVMRIHQSSPHRRCRSGGDPAG